MTDRPVDSNELPKSAIKYTRTLPTATTAEEGTFVVYHGTDETKRLYLITGQINATTAGTMGTPILVNVGLVSAATAVNAAASTTADTVALLNQIRAALIATGVCI
jgi:hypothetical protein